MSKLANEIFGSIYNAQATRQIAFDPEWNNGTGYFDGLVRAELGLKSGEIIGVWTGNTNRRRILIMGTPFGNVAVFDRYTDNDKREHPVFTLNTPHFLQRMCLLNEGQINGDQMRELVGEPRFHVKNLGERLIELKDALNDPSITVRKRNVAA